MSVYRRPAADVAIERVHRVIRHALGGVAHPAIARKAGDGILVARQEKEHRTRTGGRRPLERDLGLDVARTQSRDDALGLALDDVVGQIGGCRYAADAHQPPALLQRQRRQRVRRGDMRPDLAPTCGVPAPAVQFDIDGEPSPRQRRQIDLCEVVEGRAPAHVRAATQRQVRWPRRQRQRWQQCLKDERRRAGAPRAGCLLDIDDVLPSSGALGRLKDQLARPHGVALHPSRADIGHGADRCQVLGAQSRVATPRANAMDPKGAPGNGRQRDRGAHNLPTPLAIRAVDGQPAGHPSTLSCRQASALSTSTRTPSGAWRRKRSTSSLEPTTSPQCIGTATCGLMRSKAWAASSASMV